MIPATTTRLWDKDAPGFDPALGTEIPAIIPYLLKNNTANPAVIVIPGGGYGARAPHEGAPIAQWLNSIRVSAFELVYRVAPYRHPCPLLDIQRAIRMVRHNAKQWNIDPNRIGVLGFSAGGHLASTAGTHWDKGDLKAQDLVDKESCRPNFMILCYPVISFGEFTHRGSFSNLLGNNPDQKLLDLLSNEKQVTAETPPAFIWTSADDPAVPPKNSLLFALALSENNVPCELHLFKRGGHGAGLATSMPDVAVWTQLCETWLGSIRIRE
ncbi:MAG: esterase [Candidatus Raymondbacteria bacterium RifOxyA12_full_50_37]|uniref:Esterase n=1 Tax=Candidatus Raymondbacteria bacterium RIFOXYD12_FULL_49_13 TaxID=1817890 RepID=A0A1F7FAW6_UNCRA|nr:MAG: esterase [Candidatus Raymondbacteria bacterium RifOxyA12_full_50_37]OGJ92379.1 MAG: esterase [Candidatus Raymondbacteria bacterium RIFOXYA2_FULL_49_16]OGJ96594.1 MAG: esterase [Candidatus Raymondbacteria bacterium RifOxyB12_full_50_8]OGJ99360.1 MAG: esterase [Candidatus Raymondbacteria bacterium RIFOXYC2_FULL_50_21]OGK03626.1 MAG: esterase [Candidatus Raymondbacteria bacterium RIFOXYD12_FULL_49_13]OGP44272.1 MAG: esterase [Candidatus Raymondbacteria bacterium RIFOXYB2_FULL_49_35]